MAPYDLAHMIGHAGSILVYIAIGFGFGAGGGSGKGTGTKTEGGEGTGGGTAGGAGVKPVAVIIIEKDGAVRLESIRGGMASTIEKIAEKMPDMMKKKED